LHCNGPQHVQNQNCPTNHTYQSLEYLTNPRIRLYSQTSDNEPEVEGLKFVYFVH
jgi:hypothetical protein